MATLKEHIYAVQNYINRGTKSDDSRMSDRLVAHFLKSSRAILLKRKLDKYDDISDLSYQTVCVPLEYTSYSDCSCLPEHLNCKILRSTCKIPKDIIMKRGTSIQTKTVDGVVISKSSITENKNAKFSLANNGVKLGWFIENGYLYVLNHKQLPLVLMKAVWEDPEKVVEFCTCSDASSSSSTCSDGLSEDFPIDSDLVIPMYQMTLEFIVGANSQVQDNENNAKAVEVADGKA